jgi:chromosome segregation ATPase
MLTNMIDELDLFISRSETLSIATLRPKLIPIREQAEAQEARLRNLDAGLERENLALQRQVKTLQAEAQLAARELAKLQNEIDEWRTK